MFFKPPFYSVLINYLYFSPQGHFLPKLQKVQYRKKNPKDKKKGNKKIKSSLRIKRPKVIMVERQHGGKRRGSTAQEHGGWVGAGWCGRLLLLLLLLVLVHGNGEITAARDDRD